MVCYAEPANTSSSDDIFDMSIADNIAQPVVPKRCSELVANRQLREAKRLKKSGIPVELDRNGEVVVATLSADQLFKPNSAELRSTAGTLLNQFAPVLSHPGMWKVLVVVHSDDTGSEDYVNNLTGARAESVCAWFEAMSFDTSAMVPYGCGADEPLLANNSRSNRERNRRLEMYLIPDSAMLDMAKQGAIP
jgi:outer membrane protein OmpA-like peptidoglycan-associated protein